MGLVGALAYGIDCGCTVCLVLGRDQDYVLGAALAVLHSGTGIVLAVDQFRVRRCPSIAVNNAVTLPPL